MKTVLKIFPTQAHTENQFAQDIEKYSKRSRIYRFLQSVEEGNYEIFYRSMHNIRGLKADIIELYGINLDSCEYRDLVKPYLYQAEKVEHKELE